METFVRSILTGVLLLIISITQVSAQCATPTPADPLRYAGDLDLARQWLTAHNKYRCMHNVPAVAWSVVQGASAGTCAGSCTWPHEAPYCRPWGESKSAGSPSSPTDIVARWYNEISRYNYNNNKRNDPTGHFTQVVWRSTREIGCRACPSCLILGSYRGLTVCHYSPSGNVDYQYLQNVPRPVRTEAACAVNLMSYNKSQGLWDRDTNQCWKLDGFAPGSSGNPGTECNVCWQSGNVTGCGRNPPPLAGSWSSSKGYSWQSGWLPPSYEGYWRLVGARMTGGDGIRFTRQPDLRGIRVDGRPACWTQLKRDGTSNGIIHCEY